MAMNMGDDSFGEKWGGFCLKVPGLTMTLDDKSQWEYKLPFSVVNATCCTRISPFLHCCDVYCRCSKILPAGKISFLDMVNNEDGHQVRFRRQKKVCRVPRILTFMDGQYKGHVSRTMRCGNKCLTCLEDFQKQPVLQVGLHDETGQQIARIDRKGVGPCYTCRLNFPFECVGGTTFICVTCSTACFPSPPVPCFGMLGCDPVCCECCVRGKTPCVFLMDVPICCVGLPKVVGCSCSICYPECGARPMETTNTIMLRDFDVKNSASGDKVGRVQAQFRGNYPSAYMHPEQTPFKVTGSTKDPKLGPLMAAVAHGYAYPMGSAVPTFSGLHTDPENCSPDFSSVVECERASQIKQLIEGKTKGGGNLFRDDGVVMDDLIFGNVAVGTQVKGWQLTHFCFYRNQGEKQRKTLLAVKDKAEVCRLIDMALEDQVGEFGATFILKFRLPDPEKAVVKKGLNVFGDVSAIDQKFNPPFGGFADAMEEVYCDCILARIWRFPCNFALRKQICCHCPLYARYSGASLSYVSPVPAVGKAWEENAAPDVVMMQGVSMPFSSNK